MFNIEYWSPKLLGLTPERFTERAAKTAYRSEAKITPESYKEFLPRVVLKNRDHSVCEHTGDVVEGVDISDSEMLELLEINPLIAYRKLERGYRLLINGRNVLELVNNPSRVSTNILGSLKEIYPVLLEMYLPGKFVKYSHAPAHEYKDDSRFILATYFIKGVSRVTETQWVRHRRMSYTVMSGRGVDFREQEMVYPQSFWVPDWADGGTYNSGQQIAEEALYTYRSMRDASMPSSRVPRQDARYILPQGISTEMLVTSTLQWWNYFFGLRSIRPAQWEIKGFSRAIQTDLSNRYPNFVSQPPIEINDGSK